MNLSLFCVNNFSKKWSHSPHGEISINTIGIYLNQRMEHFHHSTIRWNFSWKGGVFYSVFNFYLILPPPTACQLSRAREHLDLSGEQSLPRETESGQSCILHSSLNFCSLGCLWPVTIATWSNIVFSYLPLLGFVGKCQRTK